MNLNKLKKIRLQIKLFLLTGLIIVTIISISSYFIFSNYKNDIEQKYINDLSSDIRLTCEELDESFSEAQRLIMQIKYNPYIHDTVYKFSFLSSDNYFTYERQLELLQLNEAVSIMKYVESDFINRITIFNDKDVITTVGDTISNKEYIKEIARNYKYNNIEELITDHTYIVYSGKDLWVNDGTEIIAMVGRFVNMPKSLIEVQIKKVTVTKVYDMLLGKYPDIEVCIFDDNKEQAFISNTTMEKYFSDYYQSSKLNNNDENHTIMTIDKENDMINYDLISSRWSILVKYTDEYVKKEITRSSILILMMMILALLLSLIITYYVIVRTTRPLKNLVSLMNNTSFNKLDNKADIYSYTNDIAYLPEAFNNMLKRLISSKKEVVEMESREANARLAALQAQINPHFICNTLSIVGIKSYENGQDDLLKICASLTDMLRYVTYKSKVTLNTEILYSRNYIEVMRLRYPDNLNVEFNIDESITGVIVPKLIIQPIIENSIEHGFNTINNSWDLQIDLLCCDVFWKVCVMDKGHGFNKQNINIIKAQLIDIKMGNSDYNIIEKPYSIGLLNVYARMYLTYGENLIFNIRNNDNNGAYVEIGGPLIYD